MEISASYTRGIIDITPTRWHDRNVWRSQPVMPMVSLISPRRDSIDRRRTARMRVRGCCPSGTLPTPPPPPPYESALSRCRSSRNTWRDRGYARDLTEIHVCRASSYYEILRHQCLSGPRYHTAAPQLGPASHIEQPGIGMKTDLGSDDGSRNVRAGHQRRRRPAAADTRPARRRRRGLPPPAARV